MARKKIVAGNWKMNMTPSEAVKLVETLKPLVKNDEVDVVFCVPAIDIIPVVEAAKDSNIQVGAENMYFEEKGAYTGEISPNMLTDAGVKYVEKITDRHLGEQQLSSRWRPFIRGYVLRLPAYIS